MSTYNLPEAHMNTWQAMLLATRQGSGGGFVSTRLNVPVKVHERNDDGVVKVLARARARVCVTA